MPARSNFSTQPECSYRGKVAMRGSGDGGMRRMVAATKARHSSGSENIKPICIAGGQRSPRSGLGASANSARPLYPSASSWRHEGSTFGTDITNIAGKADIAGKVDKFKAVKPIPQPQQPELPVTIAVSVTASPSIVDSATTADPVNAQEVAEYVRDIRHQLFQEETAFMARADYMEVQQDLCSKMRMILIDWLIEVHMRYKFRSETMHLTVSLIDRFLTKMPVARKRLQLVGVVAMFIASKFEEINPPEVHDWVYITDKACTKEEVLVMECTMLTALNFQIMSPTAAHFLPELQKANGCSSVHCQLVQYIVELGLLEMHMLEYKPSHVVSAALLLSNELLGCTPVWPENMVQEFRCTEASLQSCVAVFRQLLEADRAGAGGQLQAVHNKFARPERHSVSTMKH